MKSHILIVRSRLDPYGKVVTKLLINLNETRKYGADGEVEKAHLRICYGVIGAALSGGRKQTYEFPACYVRSCGEGGRICLTGSSPFQGAVFLEPDSLQGNRVGSFIMNKIVEWATNWPDAEINQIKLFANQGRGENKLRRNRFYEQFGIRFDYKDDTHAEGLARLMQARSLTPWTQPPDNLSVMRLDEFLDEQEECLYDAQRDLGALTGQIERLRSEISDARNSPIRFATKTIWTNYGQIIVGLIIRSVGAIIILGGPIWLLWCIF